MNEINNTDDLNQYYDIINSLIDNYIINHKIRPSELSSYLSNLSEAKDEILRKSGLSEIKGADIILKSIVRDRVAMESDGILTFESFKHFESNDFKLSSLKQCIYKDVKECNKDIKKVLVDYFSENGPDINLSNLEAINYDNHEFLLSDWKNDDWKVIIYSYDEIEIIKNNIINFLFTESENKEVEIIEGISVKLSDLINLEDFKKKMSLVLNGNSLNKVISKCLGEDWSYHGEFRDYIIWVS